MYAENLISTPEAQADFYPTPKRVSYKHFTVLLLQQSFQFLLGE